MRNMPRILILILALLGFSSFATATAPSIDDLGWIAGSWRGELFGANSAESWSAPEANHMVGVFRMWSAKGPSVYELLEILEQQDQETGESAIFLRFKHYNPATLEAWEKDEPLEFRLTEMDERRALFTATREEQKSVTSMQYSREGDTLQVRVTGEHKSGEPFEFTAEFDRQRD